MQYQLCNLNVCFMPTANGSINFKTKGKLKLMHILILHKNKLPFSMQSNNSVKTPKVCITCTCIYAYSHMGLF